MNENEVIENEELNETENNKEKAEKMLKEVDGIIRRVLNCAHDMSQLTSEEVTMKDKHDLGKEVLSIVDAFKEMADAHDLSEEEERDAEVLFEEIIIMVSHLYRRMSESAIDSMENFRLGKITE